MSFTLKDFADVNSLRHVDNLRLFNHSPQGDVDYATFVGNVAQSNQRNIVIAEALAPQQQE